MEIDRANLGKNMLYNSAGSIFYLVCQWLLTVLVVPLCSFEAAGILSLAISLTNVFFTVATFGIRVFQVSDSRGDYSASLYVSTRVLTCLFATGACVLFVFANRQYTLRQALCIDLYMVFRAGEAFVDVLAGEEQKANRFDWIGLSFLLRGAAMLLSFVLMLLLTKDVTCALAAMAVSTLAVVLLFDGRRVQRMTGFRLRLHLRESAPILREVWPLMANSALLTLLAAVPRYFLELYHGSEVMGFFGSVSTPAVIIQAGCSFIYTPLIAPLTARFRGGELSAYKRTVLRALSAVFAFALCVAAGAALLGRWGLNLLFGEEILPYAPLLLPVLGTTLCISLIYFFEVLLVIARRLKVMTLIHLAAVLLAVALSLLRIPSVKMYGVLEVLYVCAGGDALLMGIAALGAYRRERKKT